MDLPIIHSSTGPVIHTDAIVWRDANAEIIPGQLMPNSITSAAGGEPTINIAEEWKSLLAVLPAARFIGSSNRLLSFLASGALDEEQQRAVAIADCVLPFLQACRVPRDEIAELIEGISEGRAKRVSALLFPAPA
jgi:hypothetical protein